MKYGYKINHKDDVALTYAPVFNSVEHAIEQTNFDVRGPSSYCCKAA